MYRHTKPLMLPMAAILLFFGGALAFAHSGDGDKFYVSSDGQDTGHCDAQSAPCQTIAYALQFAGKHGKVFVGAGTYEVASAEELIQIVTGLVEIRGGFVSSATAANDMTATTTLVGVPARYREQLASRGFKVIADRKGIDGAAAAEADKYLGIYDSLKAGISGAPCVNGTTGGLDCDGVELLAHLSLPAISGSPSQTADIWGFLDLNTFREYIIVGYNTGTAVIDVTDPAAPREVGFIGGRNTVWRDVKVYQDYDAANGRWNAFAYVTADGSTDGLFVIDLRELPLRVSRLDYATDIGAAHNVYLANTDYATGLPLLGETPSVVLAGANRSAGEFRLYGLANPMAPDYLSSATRPDYVHDVSSILISDDRATTQCQATAGKCTVLLDFNETTLDIWNISDAQALSRLSSTTYENARYTHSGWWSEDKQYVFLQDELDEQQVGLNTTLRVFDISDLRNPVARGIWTGPTRAIDHNGFVRGNRYYMSNYSRGLSILDISNPLNPVSAGFIDTYPFSNAASFVGAWGVYPFLPSGVIGISDIDTGLYLVRDDTLTVAAGSLRFRQPFAAADEGGSAELQVQRTAGNSGAVSVAWELIPASTQSTDFVPASGILEWADGDSSDKVIAIPLNADAESEVLEQLIVRLVNPQGGATLIADNIAHVYISDPGSAGSAGFWQAEMVVSEKNDDYAMAVVQRTGSAVGNASVDYALGSFTADESLDYSGATSGTLSWADGDASPRTIEFAILEDSESEAEEYVSLSLENAQGLSLGANDTFTLRIIDNQAPEANAGNDQSVTAEARVVLSGTGSSDPDGDSLSFLWRQLSGPAVTLSAASSATTEFTAPPVTQIARLEFELEVSDTGGLSATDRVIVTVNPKPVASGGGGGGGAVGPYGLLCLLLFAALRRYRASRKDGA